MKVLLINGSGREKGNTYLTLLEVAKALEKEGVETEIFHIGKAPVSGCYGCGQCRKTGKCFMDDVVNAGIEKAKTADGFVFASPVHYAAVSGFLTAFLDRAFYAGKAAFVYKPGAAVAVCRRGGASATFDQLNKYMTISNMPVVSSQYWNSVHGQKPGEVLEDAEGLQTMRTLGRNMAWLLKCIEAGRQAGIQRPEAEVPVSTNFIR